MAYQKELKHTYCTECGSRLREDIVGAEKELEFDGMFDTYFQKYSAYNKETGKRNLIIKFTCPNKRWYNSHDEFYNDELLATPHK